MSSHNCVFLVFLRHFGCVFCKESLRDLALRNTQFKDHGVELVFVHMASVDIAEPYFEEFGVENYDHISDPKRELYQQFGLTKGSFTQLYGLQNWIRGYSLKKEGFSFELPNNGDSLQMPGIFVIFNSKILDSYVHKLVSDKPDYDMLINCCTAPSTNYQTV